MPLCCPKDQSGILGNMFLCPPPPLYIPAVFFVLVNIKDIREVGNHFASSLVKLSSLEVELILLLMAFDWRIELLVLS